MKATKITHKGEFRIKLQIPYNQEYIATLKKNLHAQWSKTLSAWHVAYSVESYHSLKKYFPEIIFEQSEFAKQIAPQKPAVHNTQNLSEIRSYLDLFKKWLIHKRYSESTINTYIDVVKVFLSFSLPKTAHEITAADMVRFVNEYIIKNK